MMLSHICIRNSLAVRKSQKVSKGLKYLSTSVVRNEKIYNIGLIPADGIGKEIMPAAVKVIEALQTPVNWISLKAGFELFQSTG